jgi:hypothetical protein
MEDRRPIASLSHLPPPDLRREPILRCNRTASCVLACPMMASDSMSLESGLFSVHHAQQTQTVRLLLLDAHPPGVVGDAVE